MEKLDGTLWCPLKVGILVDVVKVLHLPVEIMMVSISF